VSFITWIRRHYVSLIISALLTLGGSALVWSARGVDGWSQSWRVEVGTAIALLGPLFLLEELLRGSVKELSQRLKEYERSYVEIRRQLQYGSERTGKLDGILANVTADASQGKVSKEDVTHYLRGGERTIALAAMQGAHRLIDPDVIVESIDHSESGMEQYHALLLAEEGWPSLQPDTKRQVVQAIKRDRQGRRFIAQGPARSLLAKRILDIAREEGTL
jgi:hypothetical protein